MISASKTDQGWGQPPWRIDSRSNPGPIPDEIDFAVIGGGYTGLSAAASLRLLDPARSVALFERDSIGAGASGRTGGMALAETAAGDLPGLGDVLAGFRKILADLQVDCDLQLPGAWEIGRRGGLPDSPIVWKDSGDLRAMKEVPGGTIDPGKMVSGLAAAAERLGAQIVEGAEIQNIAFDDSVQFEIRGKRVVAKKVLMATNAMSLELNKLINRGYPKFTLAAATEPLADAHLAELGLDSYKPFYTVDLPYLWGRLHLYVSLEWARHAISRHERRHSKLWFLHGFFGPRKIY